MSDPIVQSIQVGLPRQLGTPGSDAPNQEPWFSGFMKTPIAGPVELTFTGLKGDGQADLKNHGGPDKAILCYNAGHFPFWKSELSRDEVIGGMFGENLTIAHLTEEEVCIGDTFEIAETVVQVTQPRQPCWKLGRRWKEPLLPKRVIKTGFCGWYLRVLVEGTVEAGLGFTLTQRPNPEWTVRRVHETMYQKNPAPAELSELANVAELSEAWRQELTAKLK